MKVTPQAAVLVDGSSSGPVLLTNTDASNTVWLGDDPFDTVAGDTLNTAPLGPLATAVFDGKASVYGATPAGQTALVSVMPGGLNFFLLVELLVKTLLISASADNGIFVYGGAPGPSDLIGAWVASGNTLDPFGTNVVDPGISVWNATRTHIANLQSGALILEKLSGALAPPLIQVVDDTVNSGATAADIRAAGMTTLALATYDPVLLDGTGEAFHTLGTLAGFTINQARFRLTPQGELEIDIHMQANGANAASTTFSVTMPAPYRPGGNQRRAPITTGRVVTAGESFPRIEVNTDGTVTIVMNAANLTVTVGFHGTFPL